MSFVNFSLRGFSQNEQLSLKHYSQTFLRMTKVSFKVNFKAVKDYINYYLNPVSVNLFDRFKDNFVKVKSVSEVLNELSIDEFEYDRTLGISVDNGF